MKNLMLLLLAAIIFVSCKSGQDDTEMIIKKAAEEEANKKAIENSVKYLSSRDSVSAYFVAPKAKGTVPAVIIIHEQWGLNNWIRKNADEFVNKGYAALAIDLYRGKSTSNRAAASELMLTLPAERVMQDLRAAFAYLENNPKVDRNMIGIIGWGLGGGYALQASTYLPKLKAAVMNYGSLIIDPGVIKKINCPLLGIFGETDRGLPLMDVQIFEQLLKDAKKQNRIIIYRNVGHGFMNPMNKDEYNRDITERSWREIFAFLEKYLMKK